MHTWRLIVQICVFTFAIIEVAAIMKALCLMFVKPAWVCDFRSIIYFQLLTENYIRLIFHLNFSY